MNIGVCRPWRTINNNNTPKEYYNCSLRASDSDRYAATCFFVDIIWTIPALHVDNQRFSKSTPTKKSFVFHNLWSDFANVLLKHNIKCSLSISFESCDYKFNSEIFILYLLTFFGNCFFIFYIIIFIIRIFYSFLWFKKKIIFVNR